MANDDMTSSALPAPDANGRRPAPAIDLRPIWVVPCAKLDVGIEELESVGLVLLAIGPADDPSWAVMGTGAGSVTLRLDVDAHHIGRRDPYLEVDPGEPEGDLPETAAAVDVVAGAGGSMPTDGFLVEPDANPPSSTVGGSGSPPDWIVGRAGMRYRDLLPGRWGGQFIASHIHIPTGGPVPDYVHYHHVDFQLIFCHRGWVRVVYQDQGDPFVLEPGDAILQAPGIRHRVLEASDDLYVIELSSPAEHATFVEHELDLPNRQDPGQWYGGQRYVHHQSSVAPWADHAAGVRIQSFGLETATNGRYAAATIELDPADGSRLELPVTDGSDFEFGVMLDGSLIVDDLVSGETVTIDVGEALSFDGQNGLVARPAQPARLLAVSRRRV